MTTTKPARQRAATTSRLPRTAPTYKRLPADRYAALDETEKARHDLHLDIDNIIDAYPYAVLDRDSHGWPSSVAYTDSPKYSNPENLNAVEAASQRAEPATAWIAEQRQARALLADSARIARYHWGFDPDRGRDDPDRPQQHNTVPVCAWCAGPAPSGRDNNGKPLVRQVDNKPIHTSPCYWTLASQAQRAGTTIPAHLATHTTIKKTQ